MGLLLKELFKCPKVLPKEPKTAQPWQELGTFHDNGNAGDQGLKNLAKKSES